MPRLSRASRLLAMPFLCAFFAASPADADIRLVLDPQPGVELAPAVADLEDWLDARVPWARRAEPPTIRFVTAPEALRLAGLPGRGHGRARGLYDPASATILLVKPWSAGSPQDLAVLLHELVHHRQAPHRFYCPEAQEEAAYRAQQAWLAERGLAADINWVAVVLQAGCTPRDIHPD